MNTANNSGSQAAETPPPLSGTISREFANTVAGKYRTEQLMNLTPAQVILKLYDTAIIACKKGDTALAQKVLTELIAALNFDNNDLALRLFQLYDYCKRCLRSANHAVAASVLEELRGAWANAFHLQ
jgi:flagellin-specific chaperone FliS